MKRNNVAKRLGIASLCLGVVFSAFSGNTSLIGNFAIADDEPVQAKDFVETTVAKENVMQDRSGLRISSDAAYEGTFKTVFTGNTALTFEFPETYTDMDEDGLPDAFYGDFRFRITDATDESKFFDIVHYNAYWVSGANPLYYTGVYVQYGNKVRTSSCKSNAEGDQNSLWYDYVENKNYLFNNQSFAPSFLRYCGNNSDKKYDGEKTGELKLVWTDDVLAVQVLGVNLNIWNTITLAEFDGTDSFHSVKGSLADTTFGLPKMNFENGYKISFSSDFIANNVEDHGTDVLFTSISTNGIEEYGMIEYDTTYDFSNATVPQDNYMKAYDALSRNDVFLGWKDTQRNNLYATYADVSYDFDSYEALVIDYETLIDTSGSFQTLLKADDYDKVKDYIKEFGTLIAVTSSLDADLDFTLDNYPNAYVKNEDLVDYTDKKTGNTYKAYSLAIANDGVTYSARGYLVVNYKDRTTRTIYTDYDPAFNSLSIA